MPHVRHVPIRTCVLCGDKNPKEDMLRIVRTTDGSVALDERGRLAGRGCYVCLDATKFDAQRIKGKIKRVLKLGSEVPADFVEQLAGRVNSG